MNEPRPHMPGNLILAVVFVAMLLTPALLALNGHARADADFLVRMEGRAPFVAPPVTTGALNTGGWERDLERQIADNFPLRTQLIEAYSFANFFWLGDVTSTELVRGHDRWLFYRGADERPYVMGTWRPTDADLQHIAGIYAARALWCAEHGIRYIVLIAPNKSTIYADDAPAWYRPAAPTPLDRLFPMLHARGVNAPDVRPLLKAAARDGEVYSRGDSHWNGAGAYIAYRATIDALRLAGVQDHIRPTGRHVERRRGDLLAIAGVGNRLLDEVVTLDYAPRAIAASAPQYEPDAAAARMRMEVHTVADAHLPKAVLIGDSFAVALAPLFAEDFQRTIFLQQALPTTPHFDRRIIEEEHPTVVIQELVERSLTWGHDFLP